MLNFPRATPFPFSPPTIRKETGSLRWCLLSALLPTAGVFLLCALLRVVRLRVVG